MLSGIDQMPSRINEPYMSHLGHRVSADGFETFMGHMGHCFTERALSMIESAFKRLPDLWKQALKGHCLTAKRQAVLNKLKSGGGK